MKPRGTVFIAVLTAAALCASVCSGKEGAKAETPNDAILLTAFGTTVPEAQKALDRVEEQVKKALPDAMVRWAYTSKIVRKKLAEQGKVFDPPAVALAKLLEDGRKNILVASLHTLPGAEFHELVRDVEALRMIARASHGKIFLSAPLLSSRQNMEAVAKAVIKELPTSRTSDDAVLLMGHGSEHHPADAVYAALNYWMADIDARVFVGTVEGQPRIEDLLPKLAKIKPKKVFLMPLMAVAGDHARNDLCGDEEDSWKPILEKAGYKVECVLKGAGEMPGVVNVWLSNMKRTYDNMKKHTEKGGASPKPKD